MKDKTMTFANDNGERAQTLVAMLTYRRPAGTKSERRFIRNFIRPLGVDTDAVGNLYKRIGDAPVLWSSHTDTVHKHGGAQHVEVQKGMARLSKNSKSNCLGADCTAGVWLMREMILAKRPGLYIFHRAEECGGIGSDHIASTTPELVAGIRYAIAFDRRGTQDVITHQAGGRCASDDFAYALADGLDMDYLPSPDGIFTDTANYTDLIGECSNISVGYDYEHSTAEQLNLMHLLTLRERLLKLDTSKLPSVRQPGDWEPLARSTGRFNCSNLGWSWDDVDADQEPRGRRHSLPDLCAQHPELVADILEQYGITGDELASMIWERGGILRN
jgi:hypothetical protein